MADEGEIDSVEVKIAETVGQFDEIVVWGHGGEVDGSRDAFVRGMTEWVGFAESVHVDADDDDIMDKNSPAPSKA